MNNVSALAQKGFDLVLEYSPKVVLTIITLIIGLWVAKVLTNIFNKALKKGRVETSLQIFLTSLIAGILKVLVFISVASMLGVKMTSFIAILSAMAFAVGLSLQGSLSNFAGGVIIILLKPFKVGDFIDAQGFSGVVDSIQIFHTTLKTPDNKTITIPNGSLSNGSINNYSTEAKRRVDFTFGIGYNEDFRVARNLILDIAKNDTRILKETAPFVRVGELADSSVNLVVRVWVKAENYWDVYFDMIEKVKLTFDENNISIPFPQTDVHLHNITK